MERWEIKRKLNRLIETKKDLKLQIEFYNEFINDISPAVPIADGQPKGQGKISDTTEYCFSQLEYYRRRIVALSDRCVRIDMYFRWLVKDLEPIERHIIRLKHIDRIKWDYMPMYTHYSRIQNIRIYDKAISKILNKLNLQKDDTK